VTRAGSGRLRLGRIIALRGVRPRADVTTRSLPALCTPSVDSCMWAYAVGASGSTMVDPSLRRAT
jgi:hypothetical protein